MNFGNVLCLDIANNESYPRCGQTGPKIRFLFLKTAVNLRILAGYFSTLAT
jgi:hypothetical protein